MINSAISNVLFLVLVRIRYGFSTEFADSASVGRESCAAIIGDHAVFTAPFGQVQAMVRDIDGLIHTGGFAKTGHPAT